MLYATLLICFAIAMMVGPLMMMRPSAAQGRIARLRALAQHAGLRVRLDRNPFDGSAANLAVYFLPFAQTKSDKQIKIPEFSLFRKNFEHDLHFYKSWDWQNKPQLTSAMEQSFLEWVSTLAPCIQGVECHKAAVGLFWNEKGLGGDKDAVAALLQILQTLQTIVLQPPASYT
jgi:hypothetical protein